MSTTGTYIFAPTVAQMCDEAFERCKMDPEKLTSRHLRSARYSFQLMLIDLFNRAGVRQWKVDQETQALTQGDAEYTLPDGTIDVLTAVLRRDDTDIEMSIIGRSDYLLIADKTMQGRPDRLFVDRQRDSRNMKIWQVPENSTDVIVYDRLVAFEDVGDASNTLDVRVEFLEAVHAGLAYYIAKKYAHDLIEKLALEYKDALDAAKMEDRERADLRLQVKYGR